MTTERRKYGDRRACAKCGQDIEWHGKASGWRDRGSNRQCVVEERRTLTGERYFVHPEAGQLHNVRL